MPLRKKIIAKTFSDFNLIMVTSFSTPIDGGDLLIKASVVLNGNIFRFAGRELGKPPKGIKTPWRLH
jgi:hypothetical protein